MKFILQGLGLKVIRLLYDGMSIAMDLRYPSPDDFSRFSQTTTKLRAESPIPFSPFLRQWLHSLMRHIHKPQATIRTRTTLKSTVENGMTRPDPCCRRAAGHLSRAQLLQKKAWHFNQSNCTPWSSFWSVSQSVKSTKHVSRTFSTLGESFGEQDCL